MAGLVVVMVGVGGLTRLTQSGLSIVEWEPVRGVVPPLTDAAWQEEFAAYQAHPEYQLVNEGMSLAAFQRIYAWEYLHRLLGRLIGLSLVVPFAWYLWRRALSRREAVQIAGLVGLLALQGAIGWWMVRSGLVDRPDVAHERLAVHLVAALLLLVGLVWVGLDLRADTPGAADPAGHRRPRRWIAPFWALLAVQIVLGAFVAGLSAGKVATTWPTVDGAWIPARIGRTSPWWTSLVDDPLTVQFAHRWVAALVVIVTLVAAFELHRAGAGRQADAMSLAVCAQAVLGVLTLVNAVPVALGVLHQLGAVAMVVAGVAATHWAVAGVDEMTLGTGGLSRRSGRSPVP